MTKQIVFNHRHHHHHQPHVGEEIRIESFIHLQTVENNNQTR